MSIEAVIINTKPAYIKLPRLSLPLLLVVLFIVDLTASADYAHAAEPKFKAYLTRHAVSQQPTKTASTEFDCSDRIYAIIEASGLSKEKHTLKVQWFDPQQKLRELTEIPFVGAPIKRLWAWLQLHGPTGAFLGQLIDPSFGMESFIGEWQAHIFIDDKEIKKLTFQVLC